MIIKQVVFYIECHQWLCKTFYFVTCYILRHVLFCESLYFVAQSISWHILFHHTFYFVTIYMMEGIQPLKCIAYDITIEQKNFHMTVHVHHTWKMGNLTAEKKCFNVLKQDQAKVSLVRSRTSFEHVLYKKCRNSRE